MNNELRPCMVSHKERIKGAKIETIEEMGYFHRWEEISEIYPPSNLVGGHNGGEVKRTVAIVELMDGKVIEALPTEIRFINNTELN